MAGAEVHRSALRTAGDVASQLGPPEADSARRAGVKELALWFNQEQRATCVSVDHTRLLSARCRRHAGGPSIDGTVTTDAFVDAVERSMDASGFELAHQMLGIASCKAAAPLIENALSEGWTRVPL